MFRLTIDIYIGAAAVARCKIATTIVIGSLCNSEPG